MTQEIKSGNPNFSFSYLSRLRKHFNLIPYFSRLHRSPGKSAPYIWFLQKLHWRGSKSITRSMLQKQEMWNNPLWIYVIICKCVLFLHQLDAKNGCQYAHSQTFSNKQERTEHIQLLTNSFSAVGWLLHNYCLFKTPKVFPEETFNHCNNYGGTMPVWTYSHFSLHREMWRLLLMKEKSQTRAQQMLNLVARFACVSVERLSACWGTHRMHKWIQQFFMWPKELQQSLTHLWNMISQQCNRSEVVVGTLLLIR